jgi:hypothetical protein
MAIATLAALVGAFAGSTARCRSQTTTPQVGDGRGLSPTSNAISPRAGVDAGSAGSPRTPPARPQRAAQSWFGRDGVNLRPCHQLRRTPAFALPTVPTQPAPRPVPTTPTGPPEPTTTLSRSTPTTATGPRPISRPTSAGGPGRGTGQGWHDDQQPGVLGRWYHQHPAPGDRPDDHGRAAHHRPDDHGRPHHDHAGHHDQQRAPDQRADDDRRRATSTTGSAIP